MLKFKKIIIIASVLATALASGALAPHAYVGSTKGGLKVTYYYVPIQKDKASGWTYTNYGIQDKDYNVNKLWVTTSVTAYNKNNEYTTASSSGYGTAALEGWYDADAKIRNMKRAKSTHKGGHTGKGSSQPLYASWSK